MKFDVSRLSCIDVGMVLRERCSGGRSASAGASSIAFVVDRHFSRDYLMIGHVWPRRRDKSRW